MAKYPVSRISPAERVEILVFIIIFVFATMCTRRCVRWGPKGLHCVQRTSPPQGVEVRGLQGPKTSSKNEIKTLYIYIEKWKKKKNNKKTIFQQYDIVYTYIKDKSKKYFGQKIHFSLGGDLREVGPGPLKNCFF